MARSSITSSWVNEKDVKYCEVRRNVLASI